MVSDGARQISEQEVPAVASDAEDATVSPRPRHKVLFESDAFENNKQSTEEDSRGFTWTGMNRIRQEWTRTRCVASKCVCEAVHRDGVYRAGSMKNGRCGCRIGETSVIRMHRV